MKMALGVEFVFAKLLLGTSVDQLEGYQLVR